MVSVKNQVAVIGGGASGMMAAIWAARSGADVTVIEKNDRVGKKILSTGNGKCNFSNRLMDAAWYYGSGRERISDFLEQFSVEETCRFFEELGMRIREKNGYLYPASEQAATVLDILRRELDRLQIKVLTQKRVTSLRQGRHDFAVKFSDGSEGSWARVILACGGMAAPKTGSDGDGFRLAGMMGHTVIDPVPGLMGLRCSGEYWKSVAGVRCDGRIILEVDGRKVAEDAGELQFTEYGISGIPVFQISRVAAYALRKQSEVTARLNLMRSMEQEEYRQFWKMRYQRQRDQNMEEFTTGILNKKLNLLMLRRAGIRTNVPAQSLTASQRHALQELYHDFDCEVTAYNSFELAQVTAGGIPFTEIDDTLQSKLVPGLYFVGELLDIDGKCGGYNLQWAFTSGKIAGCAQQK